MPRRAFRELEVDQIQLSDLDLRAEADDENITSLAETMQKFGTLQPVLVSLDSNTGQYRVVLGGRRVRAAKHTGQNTLPAFIVDDLKDGDALAMMLIENMQRQDLEPLEESRGIAELRDRFRFDENRIARTIGLRPQFVHDRLALLDLPGPIKEKVEQRRLGVSQAISLTRLTGKRKAQIAIAEDAERRRLSSEVVSRMVEEVAAPKRHRRRMTRKHKLKRAGDQFSDDHMDKKVQQLVLCGEKLLGMLDSFPMNRWSQEKAEVLRQAIVAIDQGVQKAGRKVAKRAKAKE